jgi:hypothetical protein
MPAASGLGAHRADFDARWRSMAPFGIVTKAAYHSPAPPAFTSGEYTAAFNDVKTLGRPDGDGLRDEIAAFWLAEGGTVRETGIWLQAAIAIVRQHGTIRSLPETARVRAPEYGNGRFGYRLLGSQGDLFYMAPYSGNP